MLKEKIEFVEAFVQQLNHFVQIELVGRDFLILEIEVLENGEFVIYPAARRSDAIVPIFYEKNGKIEQEKKTLSEFVSLCKKFNGKSLISKADLTL